MEGTTLPKEFVLLLYLYYYFNIYFVLFYFMMSVFKTVHWNTLAFLLSVFRKGKQSMPLKKMNSESDMQRLKVVLLLMQRF